MTNDFERPELYIAVVCPVCRTRLHPRRELAGRRVRCPDCHSAVRVPEAPPEPAPAAPLANPGEYPVIEFGAIGHAPDCFLVVCPTCATRLFPRRDLVGRRVRCPDCRQPVRVPPPPEPTAPKVPLPPRDYRVGVEPPPPPPISTERYGYKPTFDPIVPGATPLPRRWWLDGVLLFPLRADVVGQWMILSLCALLAAEATAFTAFHLQSLASRWQVPPDFLLLLMSMMLGLLWSFAISYAGRIFPVIVGEAAGGNEEQIDWPLETYLDGLRGAMALSLPFIAAVMAGSFLAWTMQWIAPFNVFVFIGATILLYPFFMLSVLESGSAFTLVSNEAVRAVEAYPRGWAAVYALWLALAGAWSTALVFGLWLAPLLSLLLLMPAGAGLLMFAGHLLGRFCRKAAERMPDKPQEGEDSREPEPPKLRHPAQVALENARKSRDANEQSRNAGEPKRTKNEPRRLGMTEPPESLNRKQPARSPGDDLFDPV